MLILPPLPLLSGGEARATGGRRSGCVCSVCVRARACTLPEVGDLLLSMSTDCWLSDSSVRPDGGDRGCGEKVKNRHTVRRFKFCFLLVFLFQS